MIDFNGVIVVLGSVLTTAIAGYFAWLKTSGRRKKGPIPQDVLFEGYEKLLKSYQTGLAERDEKIDKLEAAFSHLQTELNQAHDIIRQMKEDDLKKARLISELESRLKSLSNAVNGGAGNMQNAA